LIKYVPYRLLLPRCAAHLYVGQRNRDYLRHYGVPEAKLFFCPHSVDNAFFAAAARSAKARGTATELRGRLGIGSGDFIALFVGKFIDKKRPIDFIRACGMLEKTPAGRAVHGVLVGDGPLRRELEEQARRWDRRIHFAGFHNQNEIAAWYAAADAIVLPSEGGETWGLVVNEAMACGLPAVVSEAAGCAPDLIEPGRTGYTFPTGNVELLADRIDHLRSDLDHRRADMCRSIELKMQQYSLDRATAGLLDALGRLHILPCGRETPIGCNKRASLSSSIFSER
jgi:glycosyltransferase involved in cell wall biosynthesis